MKRYFAIVRFEGECCRDSGPEHGHLAAHVISARNRDDAASRVEQRWRKKGYDIQGSYTWTPGMLRDLLRRMTR